MNKTRAAHFALFFASIIYGINYSIAKDAMSLVLPFAFIFMRVIGALGLFGTAYFIYGRQKIAKNDWIRLMGCGLFGVAINQLTFFKGLDNTTAINASIIMTTNPILVLIVAGILIGEKVTVRKILGIVLGITGAVSLLSFQSGSAEFNIGSDTWKGDLLIFINAMSYGIYLVLVKPLMIKYKPVTIITHVFGFGLLFVSPFGIPEIFEIRWGEITNVIWMEIVFVIVFTTFVTYLLNIFALKEVSPFVVSTYIYLQPIFAGIVAIMFLGESISLIQIVSSLLIFSGVYLVSSPSTK